MTASGDPRVQHNPSRRLLSPFEACRRLGITLRTLRALGTAGVIHDHILGGVCEECVVRLVELKRETLRTYSEPRHFRRYLKSARRRAEIQRADEQALALDTQQPAAGVSTPAANASPRPGTDARRPPSDRADARGGRAAEPQADRSSGVPARTAARRHLAEEVTIQ